MAEDFWAQFNPENASDNTGINGGMYYAGGSPTFNEAGTTYGGVMPSKPGAPAYEAGPSSAELAAQHPDWPLSPMGIPYDPAVGYNSGVTGPHAPLSSLMGAPISMQDFSRAWESSPYPGTVEGLKQFLASDPRYAASGITLGGSKGDKVYGPGGAYWGDAVIAAGEGGKGKSSLNGDTGAAGGSMPFGSLLSPFDKQYNLPSLAELQQMPGYQAALDASQRAVQSGAAAKGTLLTGGTQKALQQSAGDVASQMYGQLAGLGMNAFGINRDTFYHNQDAPFSKLFQTSQLGYNAASQPTVGPTQSQSSYQAPTDAPTTDPRFRPRK